MSIARYLDAAILKPETTRDEAVAAIRACVGLGTATVCVRPCDLSLARECCAGSETGVCVVLGFPHGCGLPDSKADEARRYGALGVDEIDMVSNYGWARSGFWELVTSDIRAVTAVTRPAGIPLKVIFETAQLDQPTIRQLTACSIEAGADFVKTSTGFNGPGASEEAIVAMLEAAGGKIQIKASGGIRDRAQAEAFLQLGVTRLGVNWAACEAICHGSVAPSDGGHY